MALLRTYMATAETHPDSIVLAEVGKFMEVFGPKAAIVTSVLGLPPPVFWSGMPSTGWPTNHNKGHVETLHRAGYDVIIVSPPTRCVKHTTHK